MTIIVPSFDDAVVVRETDAEVLGWAQLMTSLLADSNATGGALSVMRTTIGEGIEGARPHTHSKSAELFYILDGELQILTGDQVFLIIQKWLILTLSEPACLDKKPFQ